MIHNIDQNIGTIHDKWAKSAVIIREGEEFVTVGGRRLEVQIEKDNQLRLSLVETTDNRDGQYLEADADVMNLLDNFRNDLAMIKQDLKYITRTLADEDPEETDEEICFMNYGVKKQ